MTSPTSWRCYKTRWHPLSGKRGHPADRARAWQATSDCFVEFDANPLAAASVAQAHAARLPDGRDVVVKVLRPGIEKTIDQDLKLLKNIQPTCSPVGPKMGGGFGPLRLWLNMTASSMAS